MKLVLCEDKFRWDQFVASSPQENVFCMTSFLDALDMDYDLLIVEKNGCAQIGAVVMKCDGRPAKAPLFHYSPGVLFSLDGYCLPHHSRARWVLDVTNYLLAQMKQRYDRISFSLHPTVNDLRSFQWFHYHEPHLGTFRIELQYTGTLDLSAVVDFEEYLSLVRTVRRYEYRRAKKSGMVAEESDDVDTLARLHGLTFERQGIMRDSRERDKLMAISKAAISKGFGRLMVCRNREGRAASATLFLYHGKSAYYVYGANDPECRKDFGGTFLVMENIRWCLDKGLQVVDFVGINSPQRGDFKTSFNSKPIPYYIVQWDSPTC